MSKSKMIRCAWIHCNYNDNRIKKCIEEAARFTTDLACEVDYVFVNNNSDSRYEISNYFDRSTEYLNYFYQSGSNKFHEFSAWREGYQRLLEEKPHEVYDFFIISNDTFCFHQPFYYLRTLFISKVRLNPDPFGAWTVGVLEHKNFTLITEYFSSFFLVMSHNVAAEVLPNIDVPPDWAKISESPIRTSIVESDDSAYNNFVTSWLTDTKGRNRWYGARELQDLNLDVLKKAQCILLEHNLSLRLRRANSRFISCFDGNNIFKIVSRRIYYGLYELIRLFR